MFLAYETESDSLGNLINVGGGAYRATPQGSLEVPLPVLVARIISQALSLIGIILVVLMMYAGWLYLTSEGNEQQVEKAKKIISSAIIGLAIILVSYALTHYVTTSLLVATVPASS